MNNKIRLHETPPCLIAALHRTTLKYTDPADLFHVIWLDGDNYCGVFGDGANGSYEWFIWRHKKLSTSDVGFGGADTALRDVLNTVAS